MYPHNFNLARLASVVKLQSTYSLVCFQIRSHAQKYFLKVQKNGSNERVPPPRPKRKASHPYPHKAPKIGISCHFSVSSFLFSIAKLTKRISKMGTQTWFLFSAAATAFQSVGTYPAASTVHEPGYAYCSESSSVITNQPTSTLIPTWNYSSVPAAGIMDDGKKKYFCWFCVSFSWVQNC